MDQKKEKKKTATTRLQCVALLDGFEHFYVAVAKTTMHSI